MQRFMYNVFVSTLRTTMEKHMVQRHKQTGDAQAVWQDYVRYMRTSTKANMELEELLSLITSSCLTPNYHGETLHFITGWLDYVRRYNSLVPRDSQFPDHMKKPMLKNAIGSHPAFKEVTHMEQLTIAHGSGPLSYQGFIDFVQKVAAEHDCPLMASSHRQPPRRQANVHNFDPSFQAYYCDDDDRNIDDTNFDAQFGSISINTTASTRCCFASRRPALPKAIWQSLTRDDQVVWNQISDSGKKAIMFAYKDNTRDAQPINKPTPPPTESSRY